MSIVTYENVDTPVFEIDFPRYLFANGEAGFWITYQPDHLYADVSKTVPAVFGGGIASFDDLSGNGVTGPQPTSTARPILRDAPARGEYDSADDVLPRDATLPAITDGTAILIGRNGIWIDEGYSFAGGNWSFGPTTYTGGPVGIIGVVGDMLDLVVLDRPLTEDERDRVVAYGVKRGSAGLIELGPELVVNGTFDENIDGWEPSHTDGRVTISWDDGAIRVVGPSETGGAQQRGLDLSDVFVVVEGTLVSAGNSSCIRLNNVTASGSIRFESRSSSVAGDRIRSITYLTSTVNTTAIYLRGNSPPYDIKWDNISLRKLIMPGETP
ncbi:MAG TPA: hypothetical protein VIK82_08460 [Porticoccaceae bacterium]